MLNGQIKANIKLNKFDDDDRDKERPVYTYQQHRLLLKKNGVTYFERYEAPKKESDQGTAGTTAAAEEERLMKI